MKQMCFILFVRKKKAVHKTGTTDDKRLQSTLKRVGVNTIPAIEEVNIFKDDLVIQFVNPKGISIPPVLPTVPWKCQLLLGVRLLIHVRSDLCSASFHRRKHMGGQWLPTDQEYVTSPCYI